MRLWLLLITVVAIGASTAAQAARPATWVTDINPASVSENPISGAEVPFSGRINALAVDPANRQHVLAGSELGGVFESMDGGGHWAHVAQVTMFQINDIKYVSAHPDVVVAVGDYDGRSPDQGGIWRSLNGGVTWKKAEGSDPRCSTSLVPAGETSAYRIAIARPPSGPPKIFVADDCGIATSDDFGATWSRIDPTPTPGRYWDVQATPLPNGKIQLDTCGDAGYMRSSDSGLPGTWTAPDPRPDSGSRLSPCRLAVAPGDPSTVFLTGRNASQLWETTGASPPWNWTPLNPIALGGIARHDDWVQTHPGLDGDPSHFEVYFYGDDLVHETCSTTAVPRCAPGTGQYHFPTVNGWPIWFASDFGSLAGPDADASAIAFDPSRPNGCPIFEANDHGIFATADGCDPQPAFSAVNEGLDPLWVWPGSIAGTVLSDRTDLLFGTQDNGLFTSTDTGRTWHWDSEGDFYGLAAPSSPPEQQIALVAAAGLAWQGGLIPPPPVTSDPLCREFYTGGPNLPPQSTLTSFGSGDYAVISSAPSDCFLHLWVTTNSGVTWTQMGPPLPFSPEGLTDYYYPREAGPAGTPTFYFQDCCGRLFKISGPIDPSATMTEVDAGLQRLDRGVFAVDPNDPNFLYASDAGAGRMMVSHDGGTSWHLDGDLTKLIVHNGSFPYTSLLGYSTATMFPLGQLGQPSAIAFDAGSPTVVVGTRTAGIFISFDAGAHWTEVPGSEEIPRAAGFFFDDRSGAIYVGSSGRGLWRIDVPGRTGSG